MSFFTNVYGVLFRPTTTFKYFTENYTLNLLWQGIAAYFLSSIIAHQLSTRAIIDSFLMWMLVVISIFLCGYVFKLRGKDFFKLICVCSFANIPLIFAAPIYLMVNVNPGLSHWLSLGLILWSFNLNIIAISQACQITKRKVILFMIIPLIAGIFILISSIIQLIFML